MTTRRTILKCAAVLSAPVQPVNASGTDDPTISEQMDDAPQPQTAPAQTVPEMIVEQANNEGVSAQKMLSIAWCESKYGTHPNTYNGKSGYYGIFQFALGTWSWASASAGVGEHGPNEDYYNIFVACWLARNYGYGSWGCK